MSIYFDDIEKGIFVFFEDKNSWGFPDKQKRDTNVVGLFQISFFCRYKIDIFQSVFGVIEQKR